MSDEILAGQVALLTDSYNRSNELFLHISNLHHSVDEELIAELFIQVARIKSVQFTRDRTDGLVKFGFVEFETRENAEYAIKVLNGIGLFGVPLRISRVDKNQTSSLSTKVPILEVRNLYLKEITEESLNQIFSQFGFVKELTIQHKNAAALVTFESYQAADRALTAMNGEFLYGYQVVVKYVNDRKQKGRNLIARLMAEL
jgi:splicing factor 3B subunit 4